MEGDWQEYYGLDLAEAVEGGMSARRVAVLTAALPQHSRTSLALSGERAAWNPDRVLLGTVVERLDLLTATLVKINGGRARQPKPVVPRRELAPPARSSTYQ